MKRKVLDKGYVELTDTMPSEGGFVQTIATSARVSYLSESKGYKQDSKLVSHLARNQHTSPFEMVELRFLIKAPVIVIWQMVRHRTANINMQSGRYTKLDNEEFYIPSPHEWRLQSKVNHQGSEGKLDGELGDVVTEHLMRHIDDSYALYEWALGLGIAKEQARLFLPYLGAYMKFFWKIDLHNLARFLRLRIDNHAQWEIQQYAITIKQILWERDKEIVELLEKEGML